jgi:hypothetical protein
MFIVSTPGYVQVFATQGKSGVAKLLDGEKLTSLIPFRMRQVAHNKIITSRYTYMMRQINPGRSPRLPADGLGPGSRTHGPGIANANNNTLRWLPVLTDESPSRRNQPHPPAEHNYGNLVAPHSPQPHPRGPRAPIIFPQKVRLAPRGPLYDRGISLTADGDGDREFKVALPPLLRRMSALALRHSIQAKCDVRELCS